MRIQGLDCILYPYIEELSSDSATKTIVKREFVPVKRRRQIQYPQGLRDGKVVPKPFEHNLQALTTSLLYQPKVSDDLT